MSNQKVVVRLIDLPFMERDELAGAIQYQAQDYIPIPVEDAILDFQIIGDYMTPCRRAHDGSAARRRAARHDRATPWPPSRARACKLGQVDVTAFALVRVAPG